MNIEKYPSKKQSTESKQSWQLLVTFFISLTFSILCFMVKRDGVAWRVVYAVLGVLTSYLTILSLLQFFESVRSEKKENGWLNKLIDCLIRPLVAVLEWMEKIFKRNALWGKALSFILVFWGGVVVCILVSIPFFMEGLSLKCRFVFIYLAIIVLTCFISSPLVSNLFNNHLRADLMGKYRSEWGNALSMQFISY